MFKKKMLFISLTMVLVMGMVITPSVSADGPTGSEEVSGAELKGQPPVTVLPEGTDIEELRKEGGDKSSGYYNMDSSLSPYSQHKYGPNYFQSGDTVIIHVEWSPGIVDLVIGLTSASSGKFYGRVCDDGEDEIMFYINQSGLYYPTIKNYSGYIVEYVGYVEWY